MRTNAADPGGSEVMKSVAERVKAARELAKRLADQEASLGGGDVAAPAPRNPRPRPPTPSPTPRRISRTRSKRSDWRRA